ncbi:MAG: exodeoxyribonuclease VII small subunit [Opitutae bacterium]|nr:exodeoxyribonuclease VII small subunit [Opitutae bacterium]MCD8298275.1 exodeoxyribonuclease VII small subunit [Opitutae bacterium]
MAKEKVSTFEDELKKLEEIVATLETGNVSLAELIEKYECGMQHLKACRERLAEAELKIEQLRQVDPDGNVISQKFDEE